MQPSGQGAHAVPLPCAQPQPGTTCAHACAGQTHSRCVGLGFQSSGTHSRTWCSEPGTLLAHGDVFSPRELLPLSILCKSLLLGIDISKLAIFPQSLITVGKKPIKKDYFLYVTIICGILLISYILIAAMSQSRFFFFPNRP